MWTVVDILIEDSGTVLATFKREAQVVDVLAGVVLDGRVLTLIDLHIQGSGINSLGVGGLKALVSWAKVYFDVDELRIVGATRTSGARPGRRPRPLAF